MEVFFAFHENFPNLVINLHGVIKAHVLYTQSEPKVIDNDFVHNFV